MDSSSYSTIIIDNSIVSSLLDTLNLNMKYINSFKSTYLTHLNDIKSGLNLYMDNTGLDTSDISENIGNYYIQFEVPPGDLNPPLEIFVERFNSTELYNIDNNLTKSVISHFDSDTTSLSLDRFPKNYITLNSNHLLSGIFQNISTDYSDDLVRMSILTTFIRYVSDQPKLSKTIDNINNIITTLTSNYTHVSTVDLDDLQEISDELDSVLLELYIDPDSNEFDLDLFLSDDSIVISPTTETKYRDLIDTFYIFLIMVVGNLIIVGKTNDLIIDVNILRTAIDF